MTAIFQAAVFCSAFTQARSPCGLPLACAVGWVAFSHLSVSALQGSMVWLVVTWGYIRCAPFTPGYSVSSLRDLGGKPPMMNDEWEPPSVPPVGGRLISN